MPQMSTTTLTAVAIATALLGAGCSAAPDDTVPVQTSAPLAARKHAAPAADSPGSIESATFNGTGCAGNSAAGAISPDTLALTSTFSDFLAAVGPGNEPDAASRNCLITVNVNVPAGWSYALNGVDYRGFAALDSGVMATRKSLYMISGSPVHVTPPARLKGPFSDDFAQTDVGPDAPGVWSPCGGGQVLWVAAQTEVSNGGHASRQGQITIDSIDTELQWRRCQ